ncbi:MAG: fumarate hydratase C-terminal domain-containing protein [Kiritimatiellia bacterium]
MKDTIQDLRLPLDEATARALKLGQMVTVSGLLFTGRSRFHIRAITENILPPLDFRQINSFFHVGPVMRQDADGWRIVSIEPTSSIRFERYSPDVVKRLKLRLLIGKTTMGPGTAAALREVGGVHLSKIGVCGNQLAGQVRRVCAHYFLEELGTTEATWVFEVDKFGPFFVDMDARGNNYFQTLNDEVEARSAQVNARLGIPSDFTPTDVRARVSVQ